MQRGEKDCFLRELCWELEIQLSPHSQAQDSFGLLFLAPVSSHRCISMKSHFSDREEICIFR